jgi:hypothetical protein
LSTFIPRARFSMLASRVATDGGSPLMKLQAARHPGVRLAQQRVVGATRQARPLLVGKAQREQRRLLEFQGPVRFFAVGETHQIAVHAHHADGALAQVVRLLDVERQDLVGHGGLRHQQAQHGLGAQLLQCGQTVVAVGNLVAVVGRFAFLVGSDSPLLA